MNGKYCHVCGEYGHYPSECPKVASPAESTGGTVNDFEGRAVYHLPPPPHQHAPPYAALDLNPNPRMACEDCDWSARGEAGWIACQALVHLSQNPGHRLEYSEPCGITATTTSDELPRSSPYSAETSGGGA